MSTNQNCPRCSTDEMKVSHFVQSMCPKAPATPAPESPAPAPTVVFEAWYGDGCEGYASYGLYATREQAEAKIAEVGKQENPEFLSVIERRIEATAPMDIGTGSETSPDAGASIRERISDLLWDAHKDIGQWLQLAHATRRDRPTNEPTCPTMHGIKESDSVRVRLMAMISELMPNPEGAK